jgi:hypothetical protein
LSLKESRPMTVIEIKPPAGAGKFLKHLAIVRKIARVFAQAKFGFWIPAAMSNAPFRSTKRIENCDAVIRVYDETGNVIDTHERAGDFKEP